MKTGKFIKELLILHDCVIIPGLGGFIANYKTAEVDYVHKTLAPPSKSILFNTNLVHNDGLLIGHVSGRTGLRYKDAEQLVLKYAEDVKQTTGKGNKYVIEELGFFFQDKHKKLRFQAELTSNFLIESYGLPFIRFNEIYKSGDSQIRPERYLSGASFDEQRKKRLRRIIYAGAAASIIAAMILIPLKTGYLQQVTFNIPGKNAVNKEIVQPANDIGNDQRITTQPGKTLVLTVPSQYHIIVGSFREFGNAREMRASLAERGLDPRILTGDNDFYRVSVSTCADPDEARQALAEIRTFPGLESAWLLKD